jgi:hypothetical protein
MARMTIKNGNRIITVFKSDDTVGLKTNTTQLPAALKNDVTEEKRSFLGGFHLVGLATESRGIDEKLDEIRQKDEVTTGAHVYLTPNNKELIPTGFLYITFQDRTDADEQSVVLDEYSLEVVERRSQTLILAKVTDKSPNPLKVSAQLEQISLVKNVELDFDTPVDHYEFIRPDDNLLEMEWHLQNSGYIADAQWPTKKGADAKVVDAWKRLGNMGSPNITVAVIDNGIDLSHPDLRDKVIVKPFDFWNQSKDLITGDVRYTHGTPCASVAVAASNGIGIVGSAPNARFMPLSGTSYSHKATEDMFNYCINNGADVVSCSWGATDPQFMLNDIKKNAIAKAAREGRNGKGCVICYAAGNEGLDYVNYYSQHPDVICVSACTSKDEYATYANRGAEVTICAPSNGDWPITAARAWWDEGIADEDGDNRFWMDGKSRGNKYKHFGGTSSATPLVAGICALILSANPSLTAKEVKEIVIKTADKIGDPSEYDARGHSDKFGYGRINADRAVAEALRRRDLAGGTVAPRPVPTTPTPTVESSVAAGLGLFRFAVKRQSNTGFGVQVGAFAQYGNVLMFSEKYDLLFKQPIIVHISEFSGKTVYKMIIGNFVTSAEAQHLLVQMRAKGVNGFVKDLREIKA